MSIQSSTRYALVVSCHMEVPLTYWNHFNLEETLHYFRSKAEKLKANSTPRKEFNVILNLLEIAQGLNAAKLETLYQENYRLFFVFSFDNLDVAKHFESLIPMEAIVRYGLAVDVPMVYKVHFPASSVVSTENNFQKSTKFTNNQQARQELTDAKELLNRASSSFRGVQIETMYQYHTQLRFVFSFESKKDREAFRLSLRSN